MVTMTDAFDMWTIAGAVIWCDHLSRSLDHSLSLASHRHFPLTFKVCHHAGPFAHLFRQCRLVTLRADPQPMLHADENDQGITPRPACPA